MFSVYVDMNILADAIKGDVSLMGSPDFNWIYSNEHFIEISRSGDTRYLDILAEIRARFLELEMNDNFQLTGNADILEFADPHELFGRWCEAQTGFDAEIYLVPVLSHLFGADNHSEVSTSIESFLAEFSTILKEAEIPDNQRLEKLGDAQRTMNGLITTLLRDKPNTDACRIAISTHNGRANKVLSDENPLMLLWDTIKGKAPGVTPEQFFGFSPMERLGYSTLPEYLGIVGCYTVLNMIGLRPDRGLSKNERTTAAMSDASHVGHAAYCTALVSADKRMCDKARAIYKFREIGTRVIDANELGS